LLYGYSYTVIQLGSGYEINLNWTEGRRQRAEERGKREEECKGLGSVFSQTGMRGQGLLRLGSAEIQNSLASLGLGWISFCSAFAKNP